MQDKIIGPHLVEYSCTHDEHGTFDSPPTLGEVEISAVYDVDEVDVLADLDDDYIIHLQDTIEQEMRNDYY